MDNKVLREEKRREALIICISVIVACGILFVAFLGYKLYLHEKQQNSEIQKISNELSLLKRKNNQADIVWNGDEYNYLAIGNSITKHGLADYWWNSSSGMAASTADKDYVHLVGKYLESVNDKCHFEAYNFSIWETMSYDRAETYEVLDSYLSESLDLVTIQLGENVSETTTFENDFIELVNHIQISCPKAKILIIGDFWYAEDRTEVKKNVASEMNIVYVNLEEIIGYESYMCGLGTIVYGADGEAHTVEHDGVAGHPGDKGMEYIADRIIGELE